MALAAQSSNEGESSNAFIRARRYMAAYGLTMEDVYGKVGPSSSNTAENERYRREAEAARQQTENERRARHSAEEKNARYEAENKKNREEEFFRQQAEQKAREQRQTHEAESQQNAEEKQKVSATPPPQRSIFERLAEEKSILGVLGVAALIVFFAWGDIRDEHLKSAPNESPASPAVTPTKISKPEPIVVPGYSLKSQSMRYCVSNDMYDTNLRNIRQLHFGSNNSVSIDGNTALQITEKISPAVYRLLNGNTITVSSDAVISDFSGEGRSYTCHDTMKHAELAAMNLYKKYHASLEKKRAAAAHFAPPNRVQTEQPAAPIQPVVPSRPDPINVYQYSATSRDHRTCLVEGSQQRQGDIINYKTQTFFFLSPSEVSYGDNTTGFRVITSEGNGMYKLENGDEIGVDVFGGLIRYFGKKSTYICFATQMELEHYLNINTP